VKLGPCSFQWGSQGLPGKQRNTLTPHSYKHASMYGYIKVVYIYIIYIYIHVFEFGVSFNKFLSHEGFFAPKFHIFQRCLAVGSDRCQSPLDSCVNNLRVTKQSFHSNSARCMYLPPSLYKYIYIHTRIGTYVMSSHVMQCNGMV
jgi:hypothetical protein